MVAVATGPRERVWNVVGRRVFIPFKGLIFSN